MFKSVYWLSCNLPPADLSCVQCFTILMKYALVSCRTSLLSTGPFYTYDNATKNFSI